MSLNTVTVTWNEVDVGQAPLGGYVSFQLSAPAADSADGLTVEPEPAKTYFFTSATGSSDPLVANDNASLSPSGSYYTVTVAIKGQQPYTFKTLINFANGASQKLAVLYANQAQPAAQFAQYLPLPSGTPTAGRLPAATGSGEASAWTTINQLLSAVNYYFPSGDTSGLDDPGNINTILASGDPVVLLPRAAGNNYYIASPITPVTGSFLGSEQAWSASEQDFYGAGIGGPGGAVLWMVNAFPTGNYAIDVHNATGTQVYGIDLAGLCIYGEALPSHLVNTAGGIRLHGAVGACRLRNIAILGMNGDGLHTEVDNSTGKVPDECRFEQVKITGSYGGYGWWSDNLPDSSIVHCQTSNNALDGIRIGWSTNTRLDHHKSEQNKNAGYHFTGTGGAGDIMWLTSCTSHINQYDGMYWDDTTPGEGGAGTYQLTGCGMVNDGQAGGTTYASYRANGATDLIVATGCTGQGAYYGASMTGGSYSMTFTGGKLSGTGASTYDDGSNTSPLSYQFPAGTRSAGTALASGVVPLAFGGSIAVNAAAGNVFRVTLTASTGTFAAPSNPADGQVIRFRIAQDGTGSRTVSWNGAYDFGASSAPVLSTGASKVDVVAFEYNAALAKWMYLGAGLGY